MVSSSTISIAGHNSSIDRVHFSIVVFPTVQPTKSPAPTGGVVNPIAMFTISTIPKVTGFMPTVWTTGNRTGVTITISGATSMIVPRNISRMLIRSRTTNGLSLIDKKNWVTSVGMRRKVIIQANPDAQPISSITIAVVLTESTKIGHRSTIFSSR